MKSPDIQPHVNLPEVDQEKSQFLADMSILYYEENLTQAEIAEKMGVSRTSISRFLKEARDLGIVQITIKRPPNHTDMLAAAIKSAFRIAEVYVVPAGNRGYTQVVEALAAVAAGVLQSKLTDNAVLGIAWSTGVYQVIRALQNARSMGVTVTQLTGMASSTNPLLDGSDLARWLAQQLEGRYLYLPAPLVVQDEHIRDVLLADKVIAERLEMARTADIALVGIGSVFPPLCTFLQTGYISEADLHEFTRLGAVGDLLATFFDSEGKPIDIPLHRRTIGVSLEQLRNIRTVIGVAGGREKAPAIAGALRGRYLGCLVTDDQAATEVLNIAAKTG
ncbi:MAG: sugar-binding transcriptional regulator [Phototrophicaceae bacterium]|jgi:DNA-binding transcriptional regulator LsrR (DeoR family)